MDALLPRAAAGAGVSASLLDVLVSIPGVDPRDATLTELQGGLSNRTWRVRTPQGDWAVRLPLACRETVAPDRAGELQVLRRAAGAGLAPAVVFADSETGVLVTEFLQGSAWQPADLASTRNLERLAGLLRQVHRLPLCGVRADIAGMAAGYAERLSTASAGEIVNTCLAIVSEPHDPGTLACCHNDVVAANVIDDGALKLIDWEYAGDNDAYFDLASAVAYHDLDNDQQRTLVNAYAGSSATEFRDRLVAQMRRFDALQYLWLAARQQGAPEPSHARRLTELQGRIGA
jgi:thiamine kinase